MDRILLRILIALIIAVLASPAYAFVSRIDPTSAVRIPCHQFRGAVVELVHGEFTPASLGNWLQATFLTPQGESWTAEDNTDNTNLVTHIGTLTTAEGIMLAIRMEGLCAAWEADHGLFTRNSFRTRIGIATQ